jgi:hypothetical protein
MDSQLEVNLPDSFFKQIGRFFRGRIEENEQEQHDPGEW